MESRVADGKEGLLRGNSFPQGARDLRRISAPPDQFLPRDL